MTKRLDMNYVNKKSQELNETFLLKIEHGGEEWELEVKSQFSKSGISNIIQQMAKAQDHIGVDLGDIFSPYFYLLIIKEFTSLDIPDDFSSQIEIMKELVDIDLFMPILENLPEEQMAKLMDEVLKMTNDINEAMNKLKQGVQGYEAENEEVDKLMVKKI